MTKEEAINILQKVVDWKHDSLRGHPEMRYIAEAVEVILSQPSLPSNLDEAAREYSERFQDKKDKLYAFHGFRDGAMWQDSQAQRLSNDVDGAAEDMLDDAAYDWIMDNFGNPKESLFDFDYRCFKAGAEWMAGQGVISEGKVFTSAFTSYVKTPGIEELLKDAFPEDTEVIVQVRKK